MASRPYKSHVFSVASFQDLKSIQEELIKQLCAAVEEQLNSLVSGEEGMLDPRTDKTTENLWRSEYSEPLLLPVVLLSVLLISILV